jgi:futalosine hydrolase
MDILIVTATEKELQLAEKRIEQLNKGKFSHQYFFLVTGIGIARSTFSVTKTLLARHYDFVIQLGVAGSYTPSIPVGEVVWVTRDCFCDLGADTLNGFVSLEELNLATESPDVDFDPKLCNNIPLPDQLKKVKAVTSDTIHNHPERISEISKRLHPEVESMEGASIMAVCNQLNVPNIQVRAISNRVAPRDENRWNLEKALTALDQWFVPYLETLESSAL